MLAADILTISVVVYVGPLHPALALCPASTLSNKPGRTALLEPRPVLPHQIQPVHISKAGLQRKCAMHFRKFCKKDLHISKNDPRLCPPGCSLHRLQKCRSQPHRKAKEIRFCFDDHLCLACLTRPLWLLPTAGSYLVYSLFTFALGKPVVSLLRHLFLKYSAEKSVQPCCSIFKLHQNVSICR